MAKNFINFRFDEDIKEEAKKGKKGKMIKG